MKKIFFFLTLLAVLLAAAFLPCHAAESDLSDSSDAVENYTFVGRIWEFVETNRTEVLETAGSLIVLVVLSLFGRKNKKSDLQITSAIGNVSSAVGKVLTNTSTNKDVIDRVNVMIEDYNVISEHLKSYIAMEKDRDEALAALIMTDVTIMEILATVYPQANVPQGVKDIVTLKYAKCATCMEKSDKVKGIVDAVHATIGADAQASSEVAEEAV